MQEGKTGIKSGLCPESFQTTTNQADTLTETSQRNRDDITPTSLTVSSFICEHLVRDVESNQTYLPLNASVTLKQKKKMLYVPIDFSNGVTIDALVDSGAYVSAIPEDEMERIKTYSRGNILKMGDPPAFQIQVANGQLEKPTAIATMWFEIGDFEFAEHFVVMRNLTGPIIGLHFMRYNSVILDITHALLHFPHLSMQAKTTDGVKSTKPQAVMISEDITIQPMTTKTINAHANHASPFKTTGIITPVEQHSETATLLISHSMSTITDKEVPIRVTNTGETPYTLKKNTQVADFTVLTPEQSKFIKPVDTAILQMLPSDDPDLNNIPQRTFEVKQARITGNKFWFPTPENPGDIEDHSPIQSRILNELLELRRKEQLNPQDNEESREEFLKQFSWADTLLTADEQQMVEEILVEYHDIFARHRMDIGMNTEFRVKLTPKNDKPVYSQSFQCQYMSRKTSL